ncbi:hypothetical protein BJX61DRAFT_410208 [Aspergillus egyptiacus]|nr:hypothetical protein BJX61DRAFT_410208 [Aspergillus egyptiacus]
MTTRRLGDTRRSLQKRTKRQSREKKGEGRWNAWQPRSARKCTPSETRSIHHRKGRELLHQHLSRHSVTIMNYALQQAFVSLQKSSLEYSTRT